MNQKTYLAIDPSVLANALLATSKQPINLQGCFFRETSTSEPIALHEATLLYPIHSNFGLQLTRQPRTPGADPTVFATRYRSGTAQLEVPPEHPVLALLPHLTLSETVNIPLYKSITLSLAQTHLFLHNHATTSWLPSTFISQWDRPLHLRIRQKWPNSKLLDQTVDVYFCCSSNPHKTLSCSLPFPLQNLKQIYDSYCSHFIHIRDHLLLRYSLPLLGPNWTVLTSLSLFEDEEDPREYTEVITTPYYLQENKPPDMESYNECTLRYNANPLNKALPYDPQSHTQLLTDFFPDSEPFPTTTELKKTLEAIEEKTRNSRLRR